MTLVVAIRGHWAAFHLGFADRQLVDLAGVGEWVA